MKLDRVVAVRNSRIVYRNGDDCVKVFDEDYFLDDVLSEALNQAIAERAVVNVPKVKGVINLDGKWAIVSEYVRGKTLERLMKENPAKKSEYLQRFVDIQLQIRKSGNCGFSKLTDKLSEKIARTQLAATTRYYLRNYMESLPKAKELCHGDFNPSNVIVGEDGKDYVVDWAMATEGNGLADAARTYLLFWLAGDVEGSDEYLDLYCKASGNTKQEIQRWMPVVAADQSVKGNSTERDCLLTWVNVVDYQ